MTMPHLHNCSHSPDGWCLECVRRLHLEMAGYRNMESQRDLLADLALCEQATPGPWERVSYCGPWRDSTECLDISRFLDDKHGAEIAVRSRETIVKGQFVKPENVAFIVAARVGWPAAIRCALAVRAALRDLLAACRHNRDSVGERVLEAMDRAEEVLG